MKLILEALRTIQEKLDGLVSDKQFLWDDKGSGILKPKAEGALSDWVKLRLDEVLVDRGIVLNREVQIHRGERTDVHINAVITRDPHSEYDICTLIIEVKGCWHDQLYSAMETQLVDQYLAGSGCSHGIYLIGWFNCSKWSDAEHKKRAAKSLEEIRSEFGQQASSLSRAGRLLRAFVLDARL